MEFCLGSASFNCATTAANYGFLQVTYNYNNSTTPTITDIVCTPSGVTGTTCTQASGTVANPTITFAGSKYYLDIGIQDTVTMNRNSCGCTLTLANFQDIYVQTAETVPEPASFTLIGTPLAGAAFWYFRRRRRARQAACVSARVLPIHRNSETSSSPATRVLTSLAQ